MIDYIGLKINSIAVDETIEFCFPMHLSIQDNKIEFLKYIESAKVLEITKNLLRARGYIVK